MRDGRVYGFLITCGFVIFVIWMIGQMFGHQSSVIHSGNAGSSTAGNPTANSKIVPWDYKVEEGTVGDLLNGDMTILPNNQLLPNDQNYATGDKVWMLSYMGAEMSAAKDNKTDISLTPWQPIKTYKTKEEADQALQDLKEDVKTDVDLVGVYKTEYQGQYREFAVMTLPSGNQIKQPVSEDRYTALKNAKTVKVVLEEVHDYTNYDSAMAKFRGWAD